MRDDGSHYGRQLGGKLFSFDLIDVDAARLLSIAVTEGQTECIAWFASFCVCPTEIETH